MDRWNGKVAVVTGASAGIGAAIACTLADNGLIVIGLARRAEKIEEIAKQSSGVIHALKCDMTVEEDIQGAFKWAEDKFGGVDLLVNNAAIFHPSHLSDGSTEVWKNTLNTNVLAVCICIREAMRSMRKRGDNGHIINLNSVTGHSLFGLSKLCIYSASKHAVTALCETFRLELLEFKSDIKISSLSPGPVFTDMARNAFPSLINKEVARENDPLPKGYLSSQDVADAAIALISMKPHVQIQEMIIQSTGSFLG